MYINVSVVSYSGKDDMQFSYEYVGNDDIKPGQIVEVPFGRKVSLGIVRETNIRKPLGIKISPLKKVLDLPRIQDHHIKLALWIMQYYASPASSVWQLFLPKNASSKPRKLFTGEDSKTQQLITLSANQKKALGLIVSSDKPVLLEGVMGSGKTEIYFHLIQQQILKNKSSILLMPEIFLTNQMISRAKKHFGEKLLITHSGMTSAERRYIWDQCNKKSKDSSVVILGPRSAIFAPAQNLGLIIIDECHEQSYKQDASPRYQTEFVGAKLAQLTGAKLVLGSATPNITTRYLADMGRLKLVQLKERAVNSKHPDSILVDMTKNPEIISKELASEMENCFLNQQSSLLYLNRRGTAPIFMCNDCGQGLECKNCGINLHFHADLMKLLCHVCNYAISPPAICLNCGSTNLRGQGIGTKSVEEIIKKKIPKGKIVRIDKDNSKNKNFKDLIEQINSDKTDIIIGTQMLGRGLDLANLQLVGIINADYDILNTDYNGRERAYQLISQVAGRAGRREIQGKVVIQTKNPENNLIDHIINNDYESFYKEELDLRKKYSYPPFVYLLKLECGFVNENLGRTKANELMANLKTNSQLQILGPAKGYPFIRKKKKFWKVIIKSKSRKELLKIIDNLDRNWIINLDPYGIS